MRLIVSYALLLAMACSMHVYAQRQADADEYIQLDATAGLPQNSVYSVTRDQHGLVWIGTGKGLSHYDGEGLKSFSMRDGLCSDFVTASLLASSGVVLFGHMKGGVSAYNGARFTPIIPDTLHSDIVSIAEDDRRRVWCATRSKGFLRLDSGLRRARLILPNELSHKVVNEIQTAGSRLIAATNEGLYVFRFVGDSLALEYAPDALLFANVTALAVERRGDAPPRCWVGVEEQGLYVITLEKTPALRALDALAFLRQFSIRALAVAEDGVLWLGLFQGGVLYLRHNEAYAIDRSVHFSEAEGFPLSAVNRLFVDRRPNAGAWVGTLSDGLVRLYNPLFGYYNLPALEREAGDISGVAQVEDSTFYVATPQGLFHFTPGRRYEDPPPYFHPAPEVGVQPVLSVHYVHDKLWVGTQVGVRAFFYHSGRLTEAPLEDPILKTIRARLFEDDRRGGIWISAVGEGALRITASGRALERHTTQTGLIHNDIFAIHAERRRGGVWFGSMGAGLARMDTAGVLIRYSQRGVFPSHDVRSIAEDDQGDIWIATDGEGYFRFHGGRFEKMDSRAAESEYILDVAYDGSGKVWMVTQDNLAYFDIKSGKTRQFRKKKSLLREKNHFSRVELGLDGEALVINGSELVRFYARDAPSPIDLRLRLTGLDISFQPYAPSAPPSAAEMRAGVYPSVRLDYNQNHITFNVLAVDPTYYGKIYYRHYMTGIDAQWSPPTAHRLITYSSLAPGTRMLHMQASCDPQRWDGPEAVYSFVIDTPYWDRGWFYLLQAAGVLFLFGITYVVARSSASKVYIRYTMVFACVFIFFEYTQSWLEPITSPITGGVPIYRILLNLLLGLLFLPLERLFKVFLHGGKSKTPSPEAD